MHLAQVNSAHLRYPLDHPAVADFVNNLVRINELAENSPGFVWRFTDDHLPPGYSGIALRQNSEVVVNMSVWTDVESLQAYTYHSDHAAIMRRRKEWFHRPDGPHMVLWWIAEGHRPSLSEAKARLQFLAEHGPTAKAFTFKTVFQPTDTAPAKE